MTPSRYEPVFCGDTKVRLGTLDGAMVLEVWVPMPGAPDGQLWLGYTGTLPVPHLTVNSFTDRRAPAGELVMVTDTPPRTAPTAPAPDDEDRSGCEDVCHPEHGACCGNPYGTGPTPVR